VAKPIITIIGLGVTGASLGLGLQREAADFEIVGHDKEPGVTQAAKRQGAVTRTEWNLHRACEGAGLIVLAVPLGEVGELLSLIAEDLRPDTLVFILASVMQPAIDLASRHLPTHTHVVVGHPTLAGVGGVLSPRPDLFQDVVFAVAPAPQTEPAAVQLASDFVERVGAHPFYLDPLEHDGVIAGVEHLPQLMAVALMRMSSAAPGWHEASRLAGRQFAQATDAGSGAAQLVSTFHLNRAHLVERIDRLQQELAQWRAWLAAEPVDGEAPPLQGAVEAAVKAHAAWEAQAQLKNWDETPSPAPDADSPGLLRQFFMGNLGRRPPSSKGS
jgi:prephenate dehydrogenase